MFEKVVEWSEGGLLVQLGPILGPSALLPNEATFADGVVRAPHRPVLVLSSHGYAW